MANFKLKKEIGSITFRTKSGGLIKIDSEPINEQLYKLACENGKGHCFEVAPEAKKKEEPIILSKPAISTLNEVVIEEVDLPIVSEVKLSSEKPKRGRKPKG